MPAPWNDWYHVNGNTYGTWLNGDPRGFRTRHHREHVEGDYKNPPPPGAHATQLARSQHQMKRTSVLLSPEARAVARDAMVACLLHHKIELLALSVDDHHFHLLARFPAHDPRKWVGLAKKDSARVLSDASLVPAGGVWAIRSRCNPVRDRQHQVATFRYILKHASRGSACWSYNTPK